MPIGLRNDAKRSINGSSPRVFVLLPVLILALALPGCDRAGGGSRIATSPIPVAEAASAAADVSASGVSTNEKPASGDRPAQLELLRRQGNFEGFIDAVLNDAESQPDDVALQLLKSEALLASGRNLEAEAAAKRAILRSIAGHDSLLAPAAIKLWSIARLRQQKPLQEPPIDAQLQELGRTNPAVELIRYWAIAIGQRTPYKTDAAHARSPVPMAHVAELSMPAELNAIEATANGATMRLVFIDTGAQHTLMTSAAAKAAGVAVGESDTHLVGFGSLDARPAVLETLKLGELVLHDVPVLVGDNKPLVASEGQMALGTELMQHVRFVLDYPGHKVSVEPAAQHGALTARPAVMSVPLWTFSQAYLARGRTSRGAFARVLIDTGDRAGTFVSARWAQKNLSQFRAPNATMIFKYKRRSLSLDDLEVGSISFHQWPIEDTMPKELERLDLFDILLGHDLLGAYELTIDLQRQLLELRESPASGTDDAN